MRHLAYLLIFILVLPSFGQKKPVQRPARKPSIPTFNDVLRSTKEKSRFYDFLSDNERKVVSVHFFLNDKDWAGLKKEDEKRLYICLCWEDKDGPEGGELIIDLSDGENDLVMDDKAESVKAYLKIIDVSGPQMGLMSIYTKPVSIEKASPK